MDEERKIKSYYIENTKFSRIALAQVYELLMGYEDGIENVPEDTIRFLADNRDPDYKFNPDVDLDDIQLEKDAQNLLTYIYTKYLAPEEERIALENMAKIQMANKKMKEQEQSSNNCKHKNQTNSSEIISPTTCCTKEECNSNAVSPKLFSSMTEKEKVELLIAFFNYCNIDCSVQDGELLVGNSFEFFIKLRGKTGIHFSVEVWKEGDSLDGLEMEEIIEMAELKTLKYRGFQDIFYEGISLVSNLDIDRAMRSKKMICDENVIMNIIRNRFIAILKDVIKLEGYADNMPTEFCIDSYYSGKSITAYELLSTINKVQF